MDTTQRVDYSLNIPKLLEHDRCYETMKRAERIIHLLSLNADRVDEFTYTINSVKVTLPKKYYFGNVPVFFLPGWGCYTLGDIKALDISFHLPRGHDQLLADITSTKIFLDRYTSLHGNSAKKKAVDSWKRKMKDRIAS